MSNPIANPGQFAAEADVRAMWKDGRILELREQVKRMFAEANGERPPADALACFDEGIDEFVTNWLFKAAASDAQHPRIVRNFMAPYSWHGHDVPGSRAGGDNPDNCYRLAGIAHGTSYRLTGRVVDEKPTNISFTLTGNFGTTLTIQTLEDHQLEWEPDGSFVITIDDQPANGRPNHMTTAPHVKLMFIRDSMENWATQTPLDLTIERVGPAKAPPLTLAQMVDRAVIRTPQDVYIYFWFQSAQMNRTINTLRTPQLNRGMGGLVTQSNSHGPLRFAEDEAVIVDYQVAGAGYAAIQLCDWWYRSIDYGEIQSCLSRTQSAVDPDGRIYTVVSHRDPGVANWLDTGGRSTVFTILRWQVLPPTPVNGGPALSARLVKLADLKQNLPASTVWVTPDQRKASLAARRAEYARRF